jgi:hypothetical protein
MAIMLDLIRQALTRWSEHADLIVIGGDWSATCRPRAGCAGTVATRSADARLEEWSRWAGPACATSSHATWQSINESRYAVLHTFLAVQDQQDGASRRRVISPARSSVCGVCAQGEVRYFQPCAP